MILILYRLFTIFFSPLIDLYILYRLVRNKEDKKRLKERFGFSSIQRPNGKIFWFQCASVGESSSVLSLIDEIIKKSNEKITVLITTGTVSSAKFLEKNIKNKNNIIHQYTPIDKYFVVKRFLKYWQPEVLITVESEIWPNIITLSHTFCKKVIIVNAKISKKSYFIWKKIESFKNQIFQSIDICYTQSSLEEYKFHELGIKNSIFLGNLKFNVSNFSINESLKKQLIQTTSFHRVVVCSCTHKKEETLLLKLYNILKKDFSNLLFIVAIRHPERSQEVFNIFNRQLVVKRKSLNEIITNDTNIYLYDVIGDMATLYHIYDIVIMCGSLCNGMKGHSPIEAAKNNSIVLTGPNITNNKNLFLELIRNNACIICKGENDILIKNLANKIKELFLNFDTLMRYKKSIELFFQQTNNIVLKISNDILFNINKDSYKQ